MCDEKVGSRQTILPEPSSVYIHSRDSGRFTIRIKLKRVLTQPPAIYPKESRC